MKIVKKNLFFSILLNIIFAIFCVSLCFKNNNNFPCKIKQSGVVIVGKKIAQTTGFPTANIPYINNSMDATVFISTIKYNGKIYKGATFYNKQRNILESHILDFNEDIYDKEIEVCLIKKIRDGMKFKSKEEAEKQLMQDVENAKKIFQP
jgi:riboflavin kinase/FMN adenylyltransferase